MKMKGFNKFEKKLDQMQKNAEKIEGDNQVPFKDLFNPKFMQKHTKFNSFDSFLEASPFTVKTQEDFDAIPKDEFDTYINENTSFDSWNDMFTTARNDWIEKQIFS